MHFNKPHVIKNNMLQTVMFPYIFVHATLTTYTKHDWLVNRTLSFTVHTYDARNIYRLPPSVRLTTVHPNKNGGPPIMTLYVTVPYFKSVDWLGYQDKTKLNIQDIWTNGKSTHTYNK